MLKKTIKFESFDGEPLQEDFYFNLSKAEIAEMEMVQKDGLVKYLEKIIKEEDREKLIALFKDLISKSFGVRSEDGRRFTKTPESTLEFVSTNAYSELFLELATNAEMAAEFVNGIVPASMQEAVAAATKDGSAALPAANETPSDGVPEWLREGRTPTQEEVRRATPEQLQMAFQRKDTDMATTPAPVVFDPAPPVA